MPDPTAMVLASSLAAAFGIFVVFSIRRSIAAGRRWIEIAGNDSQVESAGDSPYQSPALVALPPDLPTGRVAVWYYRPFDLVGIGFVFLVFSFLVLAAAGAPRDAVEALNPGTLVFNIAFQFVIAGAVAVLVTRRVGMASWLGLRWSSWPWVVLIAPGAVVFMWFVFGGLQASGYMKWMESLGVETTQETVQLLQKSENPLVLGLMAFAAVVAAPLCEELVFRGYFYPVMKKFAGPWPAAVCSALVFSAAHGNLTALPPLFLFGCLLVFVYEKTGSLWAPIAVHFCFNGATVLIQIAGRYIDLPLQP